MYLTRHATFHGACWAVDGDFLPESVGLDTLLQLPEAAMRDTLRAARTGRAAEGALLPPIEHNQEVWAAGVTYLRSREARMAESDTADLYEKVYDAQRVGFRYEGEEAERAGWYYDTRVAGNANSGHRYGTDSLSGEEKIALVEYLKLR